MKKLHITNKKSSLSLSLSLLTKIEIIFAFSLLLSVFGFTFFAKNQAGAAAETKCVAGNFAQFNSCITGAVAGNTTTVLVANDFNFTEMTTVPANATVRICSGNNGSGSTDCAVNTPYIYKISRDANSVYGGRFLAVYGGGNSLTLSNITVDGGGAANNAATGLVADCGNLVFIRNGGNFTLDAGATLQNNYMTGSAGDWTCDQGAAIILSNGGTVNILSGSQILNNSAASNGSGGAISADSLDGNAQTVNMSGGLVSGNYSVGAGGAFYADNSGVGTVFNLTGGTISGNTGVAGGAVYLSGTNKMNISDVLFANNSANFGGAILFNASNTLNIKNTVFSDNSASNAGGAIEMDFGNPLVKTAIQSSTFTGNSAGDYGGAIAWSSYARYENLIVDANLSDGAKSTTFANNTASSLQRATSSADIATYNTNIFAKSWSVPNSFNSGTVVGYNNYDIQYTGTQVFALTFATNGGANIDPQYVAANIFATEPAATTRAGYTFAGWFTDNETFANEFDFSTEISADLTLYAKWTKNLPPQNDNENETSPTENSRNPDEIIPAAPNTGLDFREN